MARIAIGGILHESHSFADRCTGLGDFAKLGIYQGEEILTLRGSPGAIGGMLEGLGAIDHTILPLIYSAAMPGGSVCGPAWDQLRENLLHALREALPVEGVLLSLHGAMVAVNELDCEGSLLEEVRSLAGPDCCIVASLDMHANVSPRMVANANALVAFNTNPHLDARERGREAFQLLETIVHKKADPKIAFRHPPLMLSALATATEREPLSLGHAIARRYRENPRVLNISVCGGFAYADTPYSGVSVTVTTDGDQDLAEKIAEEIATALWENRRAGDSMGEVPWEAVRRAIQASATPVVLADVGDNVGGGSPGDGTVLLELLLRQRAEDAVVVINDAEVAEMAKARGAGTMINTSVGGKTDRRHGTPVAIKGRVVSISDGKYAISPQNHFANLLGKEATMGTTAVIRCGGVSILVTSNKTPPGDLNQLLSQGIDPQAQKVIVVKSAVAFRGAYEPIAGEIIEVNTPGLGSSDITSFNHEHIHRPIYPWDRDPVTELGMRR